MEKDQVFSEAIEKASDFKFGKNVAQVFDDMVNRSVPFYAEMQRMIAELAAEHVQEDTDVYDLGCSTGTSFLMMQDLIPDRVRFIGIDDSSAMLQKCESKLCSPHFNHPYELRLADLNSELKISNASVVNLCLTLQFVRPLHREKLLRNIYEGMVPGGVLIVTEKILAENQNFNRDFIRYYYNYKRRENYSEMEIAQKREALENVLIPYKLSENILMLREAGFDQCEVFFKWYNFAGIIALKNKDNI